MSNSSEALNEALIARWLGADAATLMPQAAALRDAGHGAVVSYSRKVFIPLTRLCRDSCFYCTFATAPQPGRNAYLTPDEVLAIARAGRDAGCHEALFTLGDKPELRYKAARDELAKALMQANFALIRRGAPEQERAYLVGLEHGPRGLMSAEDSLTELARLVRTAGGWVVGETTQRREHPDPATYIGSGKLEEVQRARQDTGYSLVVFDEQLSPAQQLDLQGFVKFVLDCSLDNRLTADAVRGRYPPNGGPSLFERTLMRLGAVDRLNDSDLLRSAAGVLRYAAANNVNVYPFDPEGLPSAERGKNSYQEPTRARS